MYKDLIVDHLSKKICGGTGCPLWYKYMNILCIDDSESCYRKVSINMELYSTLKHADEGLVVHSVSSVCAYS